MKINLDVTKTVKKSNILNELRNANASLVEYRLFCVYLAHMSMNTEDNVVKFSLADYARIAGLDRPRYLDLKAQAENIVGMTAFMPDDEGGFSVKNIMTEFKLFKEDEQWMVSLECNPKIAHLIREQKGFFLRYKLYNTMYLKSYNQQRLYELLKQYEKPGARAIELVDLRAFLSIGADEYPIWGDFSQKVLKVAQKALKENTDIYFEYEPIKKGRKVVAVKFEIFKNNGFIDQLCIDDFLPEGENDVIYDGEEITASAGDSEDPNQITIDEELNLREKREKRAEICCGFDDEIFDEFTDAQLKELRALAWDNVDPDDVEREAGLLGNVRSAKEYVVANYIRLKIFMCDARGKEIEHRYGFIRSAVRQNYQQ